MTEQRTSGATVTMQDMGRWLQHQGIGLVPRGESVNLFTIGDGELTDEVWVRVTRFATDEAGLRPLAPRPVHGRRPAGRLGGRLRGG